MNQLDSLLEVFIANIPFEDINTYRANVSDKDKLVRTDFMLDPAVVNNLITKEQKIGAMAILVNENIYRRSMDMSTEESDNAISRLAIDLNITVFDDEALKDLTAVEKIRKSFEICKEQGMVNDFWKYESAFYISLFYVLSQNAETLAATLSDEILATILKRAGACAAAVQAYAPYDEDLAARLSRRNEYLNEQVFAGRCGTVADFVELLKEQKDNFAALRNALIQ